MKLADLSPATLEQQLAAGALFLGLAPFVVCLRSPLPGIARALRLLYNEFPIGSKADFADFHVELRHGRGVRRWFRPQVDFYFDGIPTFNPLPIDHAIPMMEWGLNWCVASHAHQYLIIHAAVVERDGRALIMPAPPGSGKSTLCAGLVSSGWRLLSDELTLIDMQTGWVHAMARPISLKNQSIDVIKAFRPEVVMTAPVHDTKKGTVALLRPPPDSVRRVAEPALPAWIVFPKYVPDAPAAFTPHGKAMTCLLVARESFNYDIHGHAGFEIIANLVEHCGCYEFSYGRLEDAVAAFATLTPPPA